MQPDLRNDKRWRFHADKVNTKYCEKDHEAETENLPNIPECAGEGLDCCQGCLWHTSVGRLCERQCELIF